MKNMDFKIIFFIIAIFYSPFCKSQNEYSPSIIKVGKGIGDKFSVRFNLEHIENKKVYYNVQIDSVTNSKGEKIDYLYNAKSTPSYYFPKDILAIYLDTLNRPKSINIYGKTSILKSTNENSFIIKPKDIKYNKQIFKLSDDFYIYALSLEKLIELKNTNRKEYQAVLKDLYSNKIWDFGIQFERYERSLFSKLERWKGYGNILFTTRDNNGIFIGIECKDKDNNTLAMFTEYDVGGNMGQRNDSVELEYGGIEVSKYIFYFENNVPKLPFKIEDIKLD